MGARARRPAPRSVLRAPESAGERRDRLTRAIGALRVREHLIALIAQLMLNLRQVQPLDRLPGPVRPPGAGRSRFGRMPIPRAPDTSHPLGQPLARRLVQIFRDVEDASAGGNLPNVTEAEARAVAKGVNDRLRNVTGVAQEQVEMRIAPAL